MRITALADSYIGIYIKPVAEFLALIFLICLDTSEKRILPLLFGRVGNIIVIRTSIVYES